MATQTERRIRTVQAAFEQFERTAVRVPDAENARAQQVHPELRAALKEALGELFVDSFLAGSYRRKTQAEHLKDLDIILLLRDPAGVLRASARDTLLWVQAAAKKYDPVGATECKVRAVQCELIGETFWADLVPALPADNGQGLLLPYNCPEDRADDWRSADPEGQTNAASRKNDGTGGIYVPVTRIGKYWNQSFGFSERAKKPMPSYLAESILFDALDGPCEWADAVVAFFERASEHLSLPHPSVPCPGNPAAFVDEHLEDERRQRALTFVEPALQKAREAASQSDPYEAMNAWAELFGQAFPAPNTHPALIGQAVRERSEVATGHGISPSTVVPAASARPVIRGRSSGPTPRP